MVAPGDKYTLTIREAGEYFGLGRKKLQKLAADNLGSLAIKSGNRYLIIRSRLETYLAENAVI